MPSLKKFILRFTLRFELYHNIIGVPLIVYFIIFSGNYDLRKSIGLVICATIAATAAMIAGTAVRVFRLKAILDPISQGQPDFTYIKSKLLGYPRSEFIVGNVRWLTGIVLAYVLLDIAVGLSTLESVPFLLGAFMVIPVSTMIEYFTTENALAVYHQLEPIKSAALTPGSYRPFNVHARILFIVISILLVPIVIFGYLFYLSNQGIIQFTNLYLHVSFVSFLSLLAIFVAVHESTAGTRNSLSITTQTLGHLAEGHYDVARIPMLTSAEMGAISQNINVVAASLKEYKRQNEILTHGLEEKVRERTEKLQSTLDELEQMNQQLMETRNALWGEMELAMKIQTVLLPVKPEVAGYEIAAQMRPAEEVGGDYYDIIEVNGILWVVIGDVSGHGVSAGLVMMMVQTSIKTVLNSNPEIQPSDLLATINTVIAANIDQMGEDKYMTITVLAMIKDGKFAFSGLHQDILIYRAATQSVEQIETQGIWIGMMDNIDGMMADKELTLNPEDVILLYTDGITEALHKNGDGENMFGEHQLSDIFAATGRKRPEDVKDAILEALEDYKCDDDVTLVVLKRLASQKEAVVV